jgi:hypothetical protein
LTAADRQPFAEKLGRWAFWLYNGGMRLPGDVVFALGALLMAWTSSSSCDRSSHASRDV